MAETRMIRTKIWSDDWFSELSVDARYLYLYLLSNKNTHICGYYKISFKEIEFMTGLTKKRIETALEELEENVKYIDGWVVLRNYPRYQNVSNNAKVQASIERELENVPEHVLKSKSKSKSKSESMDSLSIPSKSVDNPVDSGKLTDNPVHNVGKTYAVYGEFKNVRLSDEEKVRLINRYGRDEAKKLVEELSTYLSSSGKRYKSHYATLLTWARRKGLQIIPTTEPKMIAEMTEAGTVRMVPNPNYHG